MLHNGSYAYAYFFRILIPIKMKLAQLLVWFMTNISNMFMEFYSNYMQTIQHFLVKDVASENCFKIFDKDNITLHIGINLIRYCRYFKTLLIWTPDSLSQQLFLICNVSIFTCTFSPELTSKWCLHFLPIPCD